METENSRRLTDAEEIINEDEIDLNSPRLQEACKRQGFQLDELCTKTLPEIREKYKSERLNRSAILLAAQHYEERRVAKLKIVLKERNKIIEELEEELWKKQQKGRTTRYSPKQVTFQSPKHKQELREMIANQQREIDSLIVNGGNVNGGPASYQKWVTRQNAEVAYQDFVRSAGQIEVIDETEFRGYKNRKKKQIDAFQKHRNQNHLAANRDKRYKQRKIYANEIMKFNRDEIIRLEKANINKPNLLSFLRRLDGSLWEHRYEWRRRKNVEEFRTNHLAEYFDDMPQYNSQKQMEKEANQRDYASEIARNQTQQWLENNKAEFEAGMDEFNRHKDYVMTPIRIKRTLRQIETKPANTKEVVQDTIAALENAHRGYAKTQGRPTLEEDSSDDEWEIKYYGRSPMSHGPIKRNLSVDVDAYEEKNDLRSSYAAGFVSTNGYKTQQSWNSGFMSTRSRKNDPKTLSAGFAKAKMEEKQWDSERKSSQRATRDTFFGAGGDEDNYDRKHREDHRRALQGVKIEYDKEVMGMVLEEQHRDLERKYLLRSAIHPKEKRYYDKVFSAEKVAYNTQLNKLMKDQDDIYKNMSRGYVSP